MKSKKEYLAELTRRAKESHVYRDYQLTGLQIADLLHDRAHRSLYIKLAKERNARELIALAKDVAARPGVRKRGAYFMKVLAERKKDQENRR